MSIPGHTTKNEPADAQVVSNGLDSAESLDAGDEVEAGGSPFAPYILPTSNDQFMARSSSDVSPHVPQLNLDFGEPIIGQDRNPFADFRADVADRRLQAMADVFHTTPENVSRLLAAIKPEEIPPAEQQARCAAAQSECMDAIGNVQNGTANAGDLASLLASYGTLNGFAKGSFAQSYVNAAISAVRQGMAAAAANIAHPTGLSNAEVMHQRLSRFQVEMREKHSAG